jgi:hypothetical protein
MRLVLEQPCEAHGWAFFHHTCGERECRHIFDEHLPCPWSREIIDLDHLPDEMVVALAKFKYQGNDKDEAHWWGLLSDRGREVRLDEARDLLRAALSALYIERGSTG